MRKSLILIGLLVRLAGADSWSPPQGLEQIPLWPQGAEVLSRGVAKFDEPTRFVTHVRIPTYTFYKAKVDRGGATLIVFPGGGYKVLAMDIEGTEVCNLFSQAGINCVLVKYRVPYSGCYYDNKQHKNVTPEVPMALQDAQRAISLIRSRASELGIHPGRIGVMGFSAGGNVAVLASTRFSQRSYKPIDEIDQVGCRPDFAVPCYPGHMVMTHKNKRPWQTAHLELNTDIPISQSIPPTFLVHAQDDPVDPYYYSEVYARELKKAGVPYRLKGYRHGGHAFGVRKTGVDADHWPEDVLTWMVGLGMYHRDP